MRHFYQSSWNWLCIISRKYWWQSLWHQWYIYTVVCTGRHEWAHSMPRDILTCGGAEFKPLTFQVKDDQQLCPLIHIQYVLSSNTAFENTCEGQTTRAHPWLTLSPIKQAFHRNQYVSLWPFHKHNERTGSEPTKSITAETRHGSPKLLLRQSHSGREKSLLWNVKSNPSFIFLGRTQSAAQTGPSPPGGLLSLCTWIIWKAVGILRRTSSEEEELIQS